MIISAALFAATLFLAYSNGANDNFKGVATLYGSNVTSYRTALTVATAATFAGGVCSIVFAKGLITAFSGKGLVGGDLAQSPEFLLSIAMASGITVMLATKYGFPVSTTHGIIGALIGTGLVAGHSKINLSLLEHSFLAPLLISPIASIFMTAIAYKAIHEVANGIGIQRTLCVCIGPAKFVPLSDARLMETCKEGRLVATVGTTDECAYKYQGNVVGVSVQAVVDSMHYASAASLSFARGLNDTPKIVGLLLAVKWLNINHGVLIVAIAIALGGLINARRVANTMAKKISRMNDGQALTANLITAFLVICASKLGMPVSTTHVCVGAITGVGLVNHSVDRNTIKGIVLSWVLTLPIAATCGAALYPIVRQLPLT